MTVAALASSIEYNGNGGTTVFAAPFRYLSTAHLEVKAIAADGTVTTLALGVDYSATAGPTDAGGTVTLGVAPALGTRLRIKRVTPRSQATDYTTGDDFPAESHETGLDRAMLVDQEQDDKIADTAARALLVPEGEAVATIPAAADRAGLFLAFTAGGEPIGATGTGADAALRADLAVTAAPGTAGANLVGWLGRLTGMVAQSLRRKLARTVDILDFVPTALHDGILDKSDIATDITPYLALAAAAGVRRLHFPTGRYNIKSQFVPSLDQDWIGDGIGATEIYCSVAGYAVYRATSGARIGVRDMTIAGDGVLGHHGFYLFDPATRDFENLYFHTFKGEALRWRQGVRNSLKRCVFLNCGEEVAGAVAISNAAPAVVTWVGHGLANGTPIVLTTTGALPTGLVLHYVYYVRNAAANTFELAAIPGGGSVPSSSAGAGVHTAHALPYAAFVIDGGATAAVATQVKECYFASCGIAIYGQTARQTSFTDTIVETSVVAVIGAAMEGRYHGWLEANEVDFDLTDSQDFRLDQAISTNGDEGTQLHWVSTAATERAIARTGPKYGWMSNVGADASTAGAWVDILFNTQAPTYKVNPNPGGAAFAIMELLEAGDYLVGAQVAVLASTTAAYAGQVVSNPPTQAQVQALDDAVKAFTRTGVREAKIRAVISIDGGAYAELAGSSTPLSLLPGQTMPVSVLAMASVPFGSAGRVKWQISSSNNDVLISTTGNPDAGGAPAASTTETNRRQFALYLGAVR